MKTLFLGLLAVALCSCASQTPQTRIDNNFGLYEKLSEEHKVLVQQGQIAEGMSGSAVFLAWGKPEQKVGGFREGKHFQRWDYTAHRPVVSNNFAFGSSFGRSGRRGGFVADASAVGALASDNRSLTSPSVLTASSSSMKESTLGNRPKELHTKSFTNLRENPL